MTLEALLKAVVKRLREEKAQFALAGGMATSIYRKEERTTRDIDMLILSGTDTLILAKEIIEDFGLHAGVARKADLEGGPHFAVKRKRTAPFLMVGRSKEDPDKPGLDFILPDMPWFNNALERAQHNQIDFGFGAIPCLSVEDVILAKFYALKNNETRFRDLDDLQSIFAADHDLNLAYVSDQMFQLELPLPKAIVAEAPEALRKSSKALRRQLRGST